MDNVLNNWHVLKQTENENIYPLTLYLNPLQQKKTYVCKDVKEIFLMLFCFVFFRHSEINLRTPVFIFRQSTAPVNK